MNYKRGLSDVVTMLLLVALTLVLVGIVWGVVNSLIEGKIKESEACSLLFGKISINSKNTCFASPNLQFEIDRGDIEVDELIVAVRGKTDSITVHLGDVADPLVEDTIPSKKGGKTYFLNTASIGVPESIKVAPVVNGVICDIADTLLDIDNC